MNKRKSTVDASSASGKSKRPRLAPVAIIEPQAADPVSRTFSVERLLVSD